MFKGIINFIGGRKQIESKDLDLEEALDLLKSFKGDLKGNFHYSISGDIFGEDSIDVKQVALREMVEIIIKKFYYETYETINSDYSSNANYQVYSGKKDEKHYLDLVQGKINAESAEEIRIQAPFKRCLIDFIAER